MITKRCESHVCRCRRRILVVENDARWRKIHATNLTKWGYDPIVAEGRGPQLVDDAIEKLFTHRCHLALVDMRLVSDHHDRDTSGLQLVQQLKPACSIIVTGFGAVSTYRKATEAGAVGYFGKEEDPQELRSAIQNALSETCLGTLELSPPNWLVEEVVPRLRPVNRVPIAEEEIRDLLAGLFPTARQVKLEALHRAPATGISADDAVRHRSLVFKLIVGRQQPFLVKLATTDWGNPGNDKISREVSNYHTHVDHQLGGNHHAHLILHRRLWNLGGVVYTFIGDSEEASIFSTFYTEQIDPYLIVKPLQHFFQIVWQNKYQLATPLSVSLFESYDQRLSQRLSRSLAEWQQQPTVLSFAGIERALPDPRSWLSNKWVESRLPNVRQCVIHGDLHADNLFADRTGHSWVIDFERTGEGHLLGDFVELEQDILTRLAGLGENEFRLFYELVVTLVEPATLHESLKATTTVQNHPGAYKALQVIQGLRQIATEVCKPQDSREYYWGLLLDALFVNSQLDPVREPLRWGKTLLLGSILCARLDSWDQPDWRARMLPHDAGLADSVGQRSRFC